MNKTTKLMTREERATIGADIQRLMFGKDFRDQARIARCVLETFAGNAGHTDSKEVFLRIHEVVDYLDFYAKKDEIETDPQLARQEWTVHPPNKERKS